MNMIPGPKPNSPGDAQSGDITGRQEFYEPFFGFTERPFTLVPDPSFMLWAPQYRRAYSVLEFGVVSRSPITLITGGVGCGKTTLLRALLDQIDDNIRVGLISNAQGGRGELIQWVLNALGQEFNPDDSYVTLFQSLQDFLIQEYASGRRVALIFDEAQNLSHETLEELRMLTNINSGKDEVLQLILVGQPELREIIRHPSLEQLAQRIAVSFHLNPLDEKTTGEFITHRLKLAGGTGAEIEAECFGRIYEVTNGVPRLVNQFCDMALLYAWSSERHTVDLDTVEVILQDGIFFAAQRAESKEDDQK